MTASQVTFPGLGLALTVKPVAVTVFGLEIYWYGLIIALGFLLAVAFCHKKAPQLGIDQDEILNMLLFAVPLGIIGARVYYVIFYLDRFRGPDGVLNVKEMFMIRDGGLAIYGGVIASMITLLVFCMVRKIKFTAFADLVAFGFLIGQAVGRWGNFVNVECYGSETTLPWRMGVEVWSAQAGQYVVQEVHPTFLYECLWNVAGFLLLLLICRRFRKFDGQLFLSYLTWYGLGRGWIEGLRTDSLYFFGLKIFGAPVRTSQVVAICSAAVCIALLAWNLAARKHSPEDLWVNRTAKKEEEDPAGPSSEGM